MSNITDIFLIVQTSNLHAASTNDALSLEIDFTGLYGSNVDFTMSTTAANRLTGWNKKTSSDNWATTFHWAVGDVNNTGSPLTTDNLTEIEMAISGEDAWTPGAIFVIGVTNDSNGSSVVLGNYPFWNLNCVFSTDSSEGHSSYQLYPYQPANEGGLNQYAQTDVAVQE